MSQKEKWEGKGPHRLFRFFIFFSFLKVDIIKYDNCTKQYDRPSEMAPQVTAPPVRPEHLNSILGTLMVE